MSTQGLAAPPELRRSLRAPSPRYGEKAIKALLAACAALSVATTTAIVAALLFPSINLFQQISIVEFFTSTQWAPAFATPSFGVLPLVVATLMVVVIGLAVAIPLGLASAVYLSEYASPRVRKRVKPFLELFEGVPTVATGLFALAFLKPLAEDALPWLEWNSQFSIGVAGFAVGLIIIPLIASVTDDALRAVPAGLREGSYALGANRMTTTVRVVLPAAISGIVASIVLGASRAIGETMIVLIVAGGGRPDLSFNPAEGAQTMTAYIASRAKGDIAQGTIVYDTIFAVGALLFVFTLTMNIVAIRLVRRFREVYE